MSKMKKILKSLMDEAGHSPYHIEHETGLPANTTYRFLKGDIKNPSSETVKQWAKVYGLTESQLRGDMPIDGMEIPDEKPELKDLLTVDEYKHVSLVKSMDDATRDMLYAIAEKLVSNTPSSARDLGVNAELHKNSPTKKRIKNPSEDGRHFYINGKEVEHKTA